MQDGMLVPWRMGVAASLVALGVMVAGGGSAGEVIGVAIAAGGVVYILFATITAYWYGREVIDTQQHDKDPEVANDDTPRPDTSVMAQLEMQLPEWVIDVNWSGLARYVASERNPEFSRTVLLPWVKHFIFSRRDPNDPTETFPEAMVELGMARATSGTNGLGSYEWTSRGRAIMRMLNDELNPSPTPVSGYNNRL